MRISSVAFSVTLLALSFVASAQSAMPRPPITGVSHICMYASNVAATEHFFVFNIGAAKAPDPENSAGQRYYVSATQFIEVLPLPQGKTATLLDHVAFITTDAEGLRNYFVAYNAAPGELQTGRDGSRWFKVNDPEGNIIEFVQYSGQQPVLPAYNPVGSHLIHVGFVTSSYESEDYFFKGLLGFRPYWYGSSAPGAISWMMQQVPDGTDWMEYMLSSGAPGTPHPQQALGGSNHVSIGVMDMAATAATLKKDNRLGVGSNGPKVGPDGKWQLNLFDPDGNRIEIMEYGNVQPPCCSPFTAPNPKPPTD
jgi:catechol 2,3-dioxygenase-like lactoylglutathione lyase family enzyme